jgi:hypothetical protein
VVLVVVLVLVLLPQVAQVHKQVLVALATVLRVAR